MWDKIINIPIDVGTTILAIVFTYLVALHWGSELGDAYGVAVFFLCAFSIMRGYYKRVVDTLDESLHGWKESIESNEAMYEMVQSIMEQVRVKDSIIAEKRIIVTAPVVAKAPRVKRKYTKRRK